MTHKHVSSRQVRQYGDSVTVIEITAHEENTCDEVWAYAQTISAVNHRAPDSHRHDGCCGFPFGLDSFGSVQKKNETTWIYSITHPYCD